jgi:hypothetical protein
MKRIVLAVVALAVVGVAVALYFLVSNLDSIVEAAIEKYGSEMTGTAVRVGGVVIEIATGKGTIRNLTIANPAGFESAHAFRLGEITLDIDAGSIATQEPVVIDAIVIRAPNVTYEMNASGRSNVLIIQDNLKRYQGGGGGEPAAPDAPAGEATRLAIKRFVFEKAEVNALTSAVGGRDATVALTPLRMTGLGGTRGATGAELGKTVLSAYTQKVLKAVASSQLDRVLDEKLGGTEAEAAKKLLRGVLD